MTELDVVAGKVSGAVYTDQNSEQNDLLSKVIINFKNFKIQTFDEKKSAIY